MLGTRRTDPGRDGPPPAPVSALRSAEWAVTGCRARPVVAGAERAPTARWAGRALAVTHQPAHRATFGKDLPTVSTSLRSGADTGLPSWGDRRGQTMGAAGPLPRLGGGETWWWEVP